MLELWIEEWFVLDLLTEIHERNCALRAVGREKETETISLVVSIGMYAMASFDLNSEYDFIV